MSTSRVSMGAGGQITVRVTGEFDFDAARTVLIECKAHPKQTIAGITVYLDGVTRVDSCGIGALSLLQDMVGIERFSLDLANCAPLVWRLFESNLLDRFVSPRALRRCATCFELARIDCKKDCLKIPLLGASARNSPRPAGSVAG